MLVYHKTHGKLIRTDVFMSSIYSHFDHTLITHKTKIPSKHREFCETLRDNGDLYVPSNCEPMTRRESNSFAVRDYLERGITK
jgi:hypothetical protein